MRICIKPIFQKPCMQQPITNFLTDFIMRLLLSLLFILSNSFVFAQSGCPGCSVALPPVLATDTLYLEKIPDAQLGSYYNEDISFRMPKTTTPVNAIDSVTPPGLPISKIEILGVDGLPAGLFWQPNQFIFETATLTDGCIKLCGTPSQSDSFILTVRLKATVFIIVQETSFKMRMYVAPKVSVTEGFTMENFSGCGSTTVDFTNNIPSDSVLGFSYLWDFGDGTLSALENPLPHTYNTTGTYIVEYQAIIDTTGYKLESITVLDVDCVDQLGLGTPDLYLLMNDGSGTQIFDSSPDVENASLPLVIPIGVGLNTTGNYTLHVWDEDSGLKGGDDACGTVSFNILSNDTIESGGLKLVLNISHFVDTIVSMDTVWVYPLPSIPVFVNQQNELSMLDTALFPMPEYELQWFFQGDSMAGETGYSLCATESGTYTLEVTGGTNDCSNSFTLPVVYSPNFDCTIGTSNLMMLPLKMMPNPASHEVVIRTGDMDSRSGWVEIYDASGRFVYKDQYQGGDDIVMNVGTLNNGVYLVQYIGDGVRRLGKLVVLRF